MNFKVFYTDNCLVSSQIDKETSEKEKSAPKETHNNIELVYERADIINQ